MPRPPRSPGLPRAGARRSRSPSSRGRRPLLLLLPVAPQPEPALLDRRPDLEHPGDLVPDGLAREAVDLGDERRDRRLAVAVLLEQRTDELGLLVQALFHP